MTDETMPAAPDFEPPKTAEQAVPKKRGRPAMPRDAEGNIIRNGESKTAKHHTNVAPKVTPTMTDDDVGKAISGAFMLASFPLGSHWRLFPDEERELGRVFGPILRRYPDKMSDIVSLMLVAPTVGGVLLPRIMVQKMKLEGQVAAGEERQTLLTMRAFMEAEKTLNMAEAVAEKRHELDSKVGTAVYQHATASRT